MKNAQEMRNNLVQELVDLKKITLSTYNKLYAPVLDFVERFKDKMRDYPIQFSASFIVRDFHLAFSILYLNQVQVLSMEKSKDLIA